MKKIILLLLLSYQLNANEITVTAKTLATFDSVDARQGVAVDSDSFYAVNNFSISKHDKNTGKRLAQWEDNRKLIHLDSGMIWRDTLWAAHSNYPKLPMTGSVEKWQPETLSHLPNHDFGKQSGSFTWLDRFNGYWWGAFGNYDKKSGGRDQAYGETNNTYLVKMDDQFNTLQTWRYPVELLNKFRPMSNSGGSWGPDGLLYITGHDLPEVYVVTLPEDQTTLHWIATVKTKDIAGQGIAWDRTSEERILWGILKKQRKVVKMHVPAIAQ